MTTLPAPLPLVSTDAPSQALTLPGEVTPQIGAVALGFPLSVWQGAPWFAEASLGSLADWGIADKAKSSVLQTLFPGINVAINVAQTGVGFDLELEVTPEGVIDLEAIANLEKLQDAFPDLGLCLTCLQKKNQLDLLNLPLSDLAILDGTMLADAKNLLSNPLGGFSILTDHVPGLGSVLPVRLEVAPGVTVEITGAKDALDLALQFPAKPATLDISWILPLP